MVTLYVKTHNVTGLKYFGKTIRSDVDKYRGSGVWWNRHLKQHGNDVTTEVVATFDDIDECRAFALAFSETNNIVESSDWANLEIESVTGFGNFQVESVRQKSVATQRERGIGAAFDPKLRGVGAKIAVDRQLGWMNPAVRARAHAASMSEAANEKRNRTFAEINHQVGERNSQFGKMWITNGVENKKILKTDVIPDGWNRGRIMKASPATRL